MGYLLNGSATSGTYSTPFVNASNGNPKEISHITVYVANPVPVPAALPLLISALGGPGFLTLRRKR